MIFLTSENNPPCWYAFIHNKKASLYRKNIILVNAALNFYRNIFWSSFCKILFEDHKYRLAMFLLLPSAISILKHIDFFRCLCVLVLQINY